MLPGLFCILFLQISYCFFCRFFLLMPRRRHRSFPGVTHDQNGCGFQTVRQFEFLFYRFRNVIHYPGRTDAEVCGFKHHMGADDGGIDVPGRFPVKFSFPAFLFVEAYQKCQRSIIVTGSTFSEFCQSILRFDDEDPLRLQVACGRSQLTGSDDLFDHFFFDFSVREFSYREPFFC